MLFEGYRVDCTLKKTQRKTERGRLALQHSSLCTSGGKYLLNIIHLWPPPGSLNASSCGCAAFTEHGHQLQWKVSRWSGVWRSLPGHSVVLQSLKTDCPCLLLTILSGWHTIRHSGTSWAQPSCHLVDALISSALEEPTVLKYIICID